MNPNVAKRLRLLASVVSVLLFVAVLAIGWIVWRVGASLPQVDGTAAVKGLSAAVTVERDALGVPTVRGANRVDVARALGWLHGQDRFFQMDVLRRAPAGEIAEVFGKRALQRDRAARLHGFRKIAQAVLERMAPNERALLEAYTGGVNAGLTALSERPFEYLALRDTPQPWRAEDSILVIFAMTMDLQEEDADYERSLMTLRDNLGIEALAFFAPLVTPTDAALDGTTAPLAPIPGPKSLDLRKKRVSVSGAARANLSDKLATRTIDNFPFAPRDPEAALGSNAFALAGMHTATGAGMLANDMHLDHGVPNIWYRASLEYSGRKITGVTLPGLPAVVAGSNGHVAWGFTNSYIDTGDVVVVETSPIANTLYRTPDSEGLVSLERRKETIRVKGEPSLVVDYEWTVWGPVVGHNERGRPLAHRWVAHDPEATNLTLVELEGATTAAAAIEIGHRAGLPALNLLLADKDGKIAWTIAGRVPRRVGYDGRLPVTWTFGDRKWDGYLPRGEVPVVLGEAATEPGRIWSANHRHVGSEALAKLGDGAYRRAPRAAQIRDGLAKLSRAAPRDLLALQLDDRALFLERWHGLLMETLTPDVVGQRKARAALRSFAEKWEGRATVDAVSYRLVREFRTAVYARVFGPIFEGCVEAYPGFNIRNFQLEGALWALLHEKPAHLLNPQFTSWNEVLVAATDDVIRVIDKQGVTLPQGNWGSVNKARVRHPFSYTFPWLSRWLNMPADPLPGGDDMPRVQSPGHGASERFVVSPGREQEGIFHMPGGQSGHPLSPYYRAGHEAWVRGDPTPFLPGKAEHTLTLTP
jgi:penicillin amidase